MGEENTQVQAAETQKPVEISPADAFLAKLEEQSKAGNTVPDPKFAQDKAEDPKGEEGQETPAKEEPKEVKAPSMMRMCCNAMEALRLREELIQRLYETHLLGEIY